MKAGKIIYRDPKTLHQHPHNPRKISKEDFARLVDSIRTNGFWEHRPEALEEVDGKLLILCGNQRNKAAIKLKLPQVPTILYTDLTDEDRQELIARDNVENGNWEYNTLAVDPFWKSADYDYLGIPQAQPMGDPEDPEEEPKKKKGKKGKENNSEDNEEQSEEDAEKEDFYRSMLKDVLYPANNPFDIPTQQTEKGCGNVSFLCG